MSIRTPLVAVAVLLFACTDDAPTSAPADAGADQAVRADTAAEFTALASSEGVTPEDWFALAERARAAGDFETAKRSLDNASGELPEMRVRLEEARIASAAGDGDAAVALLQRMADDGFTAVRTISLDTELAGLAGRPDFDALIRDLSERAFPCQYDEAFRAFDFWIGAWEVHQANGQLAGRNNIRSAESGCLLTESWTSATGGTGSSISFLDRTSGEWVQVWNSESGTQISLRGGPTEAGLRMTGTIHYVGNGTTAAFRGLWTPLDDGRIRQFFEQSNDDGETWAPWFEGYYTRLAQDETGSMDD